VEQRVATSSPTEAVGSSLRHATADIEPGVSIHYVAAGAGPRTVVLLHGFPQTWRAWRHVIPRLADAGFRVIAPDYRGAGNSSRPPSGYDKRTMASDIYRLLYEHLKLSCPVAMVGHDIGLMVAYAFAQAYHDDVTHLVAVDAPLPGTAMFDQLRGNPRNWQFSFHNVRDLPSCWCRVAKENTCNGSSISGSRIRKPSRKPIFKPIWRPTRRRAPCARRSSSIGRLTGIRRTIATFSPRRASSGFPCWSRSARPVRPRRLCAA
jgi:pimeloyl-ACP methyl ester carboxylesterase